MVILFIATTPSEALALFTGSAGEPGNDATGNEGTTEHVITMIRRKQ